MKQVTGVDTSNLEAKSDLASFKDELDETDIDKPKAVPADLSKLSNVIDNDLLQNCL